MQPGLTKKFFGGASIAVLFFSLAATPSVAAEHFNVLTPEESAAGWKLLFDGKSTDGWRGYGRDTFPTNGWVAEDGCLKNEARGGGDIVTKEKFTDFDFQFDWRISPGGNSGVKYCVLEGRKGKSGVGYEYQILDDDLNEDANLPSHQAGALYALIPANDRKHLKPVGEFNHSEIIVRGRHAEHWLNGQRIVEFEMESPALKEAIANSKFHNIEGFGDKRTTVLLLQDHGGKVWFRNLKIRRLE